jgi:hypothetical protein
MKPIISFESDFCLKERILWEVDKHSGGMKFTELIPELVKYSIKVLGIETPTPEKMLKLCKKHLNLKVLEYSMNLSASCTRAKWFIYRPK